MSVLYWYIITLIPCVQSAVFNLPGPKDSNSYGPYNVYFKFLGSCLTSQNPFVTANATLMTEKGNYMVTFHISITETVRIDEVRALIETVHNKVKITLLNYKVQNPCQQSTLIVQGLRSVLTSRNCIMKKGKHEFKINFSEAFDKFYGSSFFYGEYITQFEYYSKKQQILCFRFDEIFSKK